MIGFLLLLLICTYCIAFILYTINVITWIDISKFNFHHIYLNQWRSVLTCSVKYSATGLMKQKKISWSQSYRQIFLAVCIPLTSKEAEGPHRNPSLNHYYWQWYAWIKFWETIKSNIGRSNETEVTFSFFL